MTTDLQVNNVNSSCLGRVKYAPVETSNVASPKSIATSAASRARRSVRHSLLQAGGKRNSLVGTAGERRMSLKFCAKNFVTKWSEDLEKHYEIGEMLGELRVVC